MIWLINHSALGLTWASTWTMLRQLINKPKWVAVVIAEVVGELSVWVPWPKCHPSNATSISLWFLCVVALVEVTHLTSRSLWQCSDSMSQLEAAWTFYGFFKETLLKSVVKCMSAGPVKLLYSNGQSSGLLPFFRISVSWVILGIIIGYWTCIHCNWQCPWLRSTGP